MSNSFVVSYRVQKRFTNLAGAMAAIEAFHAFGEEDGLLSLFQEETGSVKVDAADVAAPPTKRSRATAKADTTAATLADPAGGTVQEAPPGQEPAGVDATAAEPPTVEEMQRVVGLTVAGHATARVRIKALVTEAGATSLSTLPADKRAGFLSTLHKEFPLG